MAAQKEASVWGWIGLGIGAIFVFFVLYLVASFFGVVGSVVTAPGRVITKTLDTDNIIHNYEAFRDRSKAFDARLSQIASHKRAMAQVSVDDRAELNRYRIELEGMRQSCRDIAAHYNADASKINRRLFMGNNVPEELRSEKCDG